VSPAEPSQNEGQLDPSVVAALYEEHEAELRRMLVGVLRDHQLAGDILQLTFAKVLTQGHTSQPDSRKAWIFRVAYHEALAHLRKQGVADRVVRRVAWSQDTVADPVELGLIREESVAEVRAVIESLPPEQRQVVRMRIYEEKTFAEIAAELNIPLGTALGRMRAATEKLRARLKQEG
jgi:RNA polymerase sigma-70 factor (ECF subfamily)